MGVVIRLFILIVDYSSIKISIVELKYINALQKTVGVTISGHKIYYVMLKLIAKRCGTVNIVIILQTR